MSYAPDTLTRPVEWTARAACLGLLDLFESEDPRSFALAGRVCNACPVQEVCLAKAMLEERNSGENHRAGVRGGLTPTERARLARRIRDTPGGETVARQDQPPRTPAAVFYERSQLLPGGHREWRGSYPVAVNGASYTPRQLAWYVEYGQRPGGRLRQVCSHKSCLTVAHLWDPGPAANGCGTRAGYLAHRRINEDACRPCKDANTREVSRIRPSRGKAAA